MWAQVLNAMMGIWLMAAPAVLGYGEPGLINDRIVGPVAATCAIVSCWEATRPVRWVNLPIGLWLVAAPWILGYGEPAAVMNSVLVGVLMAACAAVRGKVEKRYGGGWSAIFRSGDLQEEPHP
jgi:hypothetical protein